MIIYIHWSALASLSSLIALSFILVLAHTIRRNTNTPYEETQTRHTNKHTHTILRNTNTPHQMKQQTKFYVKHHY